MKLSYIDCVLMFLGVGVSAFTIAVLVIFSRIGEEPGTLIASVFAFATAEAAICWQIHARKRGMSIKTESIAGDILAGLDKESDINDEEGEG